MASPVFRAVISSAGLRGVATAVLLAGLSVRQVGVGRYYDLSCTVAELVRRYSVAPSISKLTSFQFRERCLIQL